MLHTHYWNSWKRKTYVLEAVRKGRFFAETKNISREAMMDQAQYLMHSALYWNLVKP